MKWKHYFHLCRNMFSASDGDRKGRIELDGCLRSTLGQQLQRGIRREDWNQINLSKRLAYHLVIATGVKPSGLERITLICVSPLYFGIISNLRMR